MILAFEFGIFMSNLALGYIWTVISNCLSFWKCGFKAEYQWLVKKNYTTYALHLQNAFTCIFSDFPNNPAGQARRYFFLFYRWKNWEFERLRDFPRDTTRLIPDILASSPLPFHCAAQAVWERQTSISQPASQPASQPVSENWQSTEYWDSVLVICINGIYCFSPCKSKMTK